MTDDAKLLSQYVATRSDTAFAELVERHLGLVYYSALRQLGGDRSQAQDVAQDVFVLLARKAATLRWHPSLAGWLHVTTHLKASETIRAEQRRRIREQQANIMVEDQSHPAHEADWKQIRPVLDEVILRLNEGDREALLLRFFEGQPYGEISTRLRLTEAAAQKKVARALAKVRGLLAGRGITSTAGALAVILDAQAAMAVPAGMAATITTAAATVPLAAISLRTFFELMSTSKATVLAVTSALIIAGGVATVEIRANRAAAAALAAAHRQQDDLLSQLRSLELRSRQAERDRAAANRTMTDLRAARTLSSRPDAQAAGRAFAAAHPAVKAALVARSRARTLARYGALFDALGLSADQAREFEDVKMQLERFSTGSLQFDVSTAFASEDQVDSQLHDLLGDAGYQQYQTYQTMMPAHQLMADLAGAMYFTSTPLTAVQAAQLKQIVADHTADTPGTSSVLVQGIVGGIPWKTLLAKAPEVLSTAQLPFLTNAYQQALFQESAEEAAQPGRP